MIKQSITVSLEFTTQTGIKVSMSLEGFNQEHAIAQAEELIKKLEASGLLEGDHDQAD